jgi:hypothetical protein
MRFPRFTSLQSFGCLLNERASQASCSHDGSCSHEQARAPAAVHQQASQQPTDASTDTSICCLPSTLHTTSTHGSSSTPSDVVLRNLKARRASCMHPKCALCPWSWSLSQTTVLPLVYASSLQHAVVMQPGGNTAACSSCAPGRLPPAVVVPACHCTLWQLRSRCQR